MKDSTKRNIDNTKLPLL